MWRLQRYSDVRICGDINDISVYPVGSANPYIKPVVMKWTPSNSNRKSSEVFASVSSILPCLLLEIVLHRRIGNIHEPEQCYLILLFHSTL